MHVLEIMFAFYFEVKTRAGVGVGLSSPSQLALP